MRCCFQPFVCCCCFREKAWQRSLFLISVPYLVYMLNELKTLRFVVVIAYNSFHIPSARKRKKIEAELRQAKWNLKSRNFSFEFFICVCLHFLLFKKLLVFDFSLPQSSLLQLNFKWKISVDCVELSQKIPHTQWKGLQWRPNFFLSNSTFSRVLCSLLHRNIIIVM